MPLAIIVLLVALAILTIFPLFFKHNLVLPLQALIKGVKRVENGELSTFVPVKYNDETGFLTESFNHMVKALKEANKGWKKAARSKSKLLSQNQAILDTAADGVITIDTAGQILSINPAARKMFGYRLEEIIGEQSHILMAHDPDEPFTGFPQYMYASSEKVQQKFGFDSPVFGKKKGRFPLPHGICHQFPRNEGRKILYGYHT